MTPSPHSRSNSTQPGAFSMATILISLLTTHTPLCCVHIFSVGTRVATERAMHGSGKGSAFRHAAACVLCAPFPTLSLFRSQAGPGRPQKVFLSPASHSPPRPAHECSPTATPPPPHSAGSPPGTHPAPGPSLTTPPRTLSCQPPSTQHPSATNPPSSPRPSAQPNDPPPALSCRPAALPSRNQQRLRAMRLRCRLPRAPASPRAPATCRIPAHTRGTCAAWALVAEPDLLSEPHANNY